MANFEHLEQLRKGIDFWNNNKPQNADLSNAFLEGEELKGADLSGTDLTSAHLIEANLSGANLKGAKLWGTKFKRANLTNADFSEANTHFVDFSQADLRGAILQGVDLIAAQFIDANLSCVNLSGANLASANFSDANLIEADLGSANLYGSFFNKTNLSGANLSNANMNEADLSEAICEDANIGGVNLEFARLSNINLNGANLTGSRLWETQRGGWFIKGVICEYAYLEDNDTPTYFSPGEFERLYSDKIKIVLLYQGGITPLEVATLPALIQHLGSSHPECPLRLESISDAAGGALVTLVVDNGSDFSFEETKQIKAQLEEKGKALIEYQKLALYEKELRLKFEGRFEAMELAFNSAMEKIKLLKTTQHIGDIIQGDKKMGDNYTVGQGIAGKHVHDIHDINFNQIGGQIEKSMDLSELAAELKQLLEAMNQEAKEPEHFIALGEVAKAKKAAEEKDSSKVAESLKAAGKLALDFATKIGASLAADALKKSIGM